MQATEARPPQEVSPAHNPDLRLNICVVFTSLEETTAAMRAAGKLADRLGVLITLVVPVVVSYQLPLEQPPVPRYWNEERLRALAAEAGVETRVRIYPCRDFLDKLKEVVKPRSLVVIGGKSFWWFSSANRLARLLRRLGHEVILAETE